MPSRRARALPRLAALLGVIVLLGVGLVVVATLRDGLDPGCEAPLDLAAWQPSATDEASRPAARRIVRCGALDGRPRDRVAALLGPPTRRSGSSWSYALGVVGLFGDEQALIVEFGPDGRVARTSMAR